MQVLRLCIFFSGQKNIYSFCIEVCSLHTHGSMKNACKLISSPGRKPGRAIVLSPASASALAAAAASVFAKC